MASESLQITKQAVLGEGARAQVGASPAVQIVEQLFGTDDVTEIFGRAFRVILDGGWLRRRDAIPAREVVCALPFGCRAREILHRALLDAQVCETLRIDARSGAELRSALLEALESARPEARLSLLLALMHAIDSGFGPRVCLRFADAATRGSVSVPLSGGAAFPAPVRPPRDAHPPRKGLPMDYLNLEAEFTFLSAPAAATRQYLPALHTASVLQGARRPTSAADDAALAPLHIAVIDVLASRDELHVCGEPPVIWVEGLRCPARVYRRLERALAHLRASGRRIDLVVMPEFAADAEVVARVLAFLRAHAAERGHAPYAVLGGPHEREVVAGEPTEMFVNRPIVLSTDGPLAWDYWKAEYYQGELEAGLGARREALGAPPDRVVALDTPLGRLAVLMCKDFLDSSCFRALQHTRATIVVVPSLTHHDSAATFLQNARRLAGSNLAVTVFANSSISARECCLTEPDAWTNWLSFIHPSFPIDDDLCPRYALHQGVPAGGELADGNCTDASCIGPGVVAVYRVARPDHQHTKRAARRDTSIQPEVFWLPHDPAEV